MKKLTAILLVMLIMGNAVFAASTVEISIDAPEIKVFEEKISNEKLKCKPYIINGRTFVDADEAAALFGMTVEKQEGAVSITKDGKNIVLDTNENSATVDGTPTVIDESAKQNGEGIAIPLRFVLENFGYDVKYVGVLNKIIVSNKPAVMVINKENVLTEEFDLYYKMLGGETAGNKQLIINSAINEIVQVRTAATEAEMLGLGSVLHDEILKNALKSEAQRLANDKQNSLESVAGYVLEMVQLANAFYGMIFELVTPSEETVKKIYNEQYISAKHILIMGEDALKTAQDLKNKIDSGEDFDKLMNEYSEDGGLTMYPDGYTFTEGEMVTEFYEGAKALKENEVSAPIKSQYGYHIIKRTSLPPITGDMVKNMQTTIAEKNAVSYIEQLVLGSEIKINQEIINSYR